MSSSIGPGEDGRRAAGSEPPQVVHKQQDADAIIGGTVAPDMRARRATWLPGREPALILLGLLAPAVQTFLLVFADLDPTTQALWNAAVIALAGLGTAFMVAREKLAAAVIGVGGALVSLAVHYGWDLSTEQQTALAAFLALAVGAYTRTQVVASVTPLGGRRAAGTADQLAAAA